MKPDWREFWKEALRRLKAVGIAISLVPVFFILLNPDIHEDRYWVGIFQSMRIGAQIALFYWACSVLLYAGIYRKGVDALIRYKTSIRFQIAFGMLFMMTGLYLSTLAEPYISGGHFGLQGITIGTLIGGISFLLATFYYAYSGTREHNLKLQAISAESKLNVLQNQMQPHFLFNSLNSLSELMESNVEHASTMSQKLADLYRLILENSKAPLAPLSSELMIIENYLELEHLRFGDRLRYEILAPMDPSEIKSIYLPSLILQTLVENAVKHGIANSVSGGQIKIEISGDLKQGFRVNVSNTGTAYRPTQLHQGTGIKNTRERLDLLYGSKHGFEMISEPEQTIVSFWFSGKKNVE